MESVTMPSKIHGFKDQLKDHLHPRKKTQTFIYSFGKICRKGMTIQDFFPIFKTLTPFWQFLTLTNYKNSMTISFIDCIKQHNSNRLFRQTEDSLAKAITK